LRFQALACDYDGTIATDGRVPDHVTASLLRLRDTGRLLILVTGRIRSDLESSFPHAAIFDRIVVENGALVYDPRTGEEHVLGEPPAPELVDTLRRDGVQNLLVGRVVVATNEDYENKLTEVIDQLGIRCQLIRNKGALMVLPDNVDKATGLAAALAELRLPADAVVGVGDAENDLTFLDLCGYSVAVANALPEVRGRVVLVTEGQRGEGVVEIVNRLVADDLASGT
jgi:HAD superfamily hydrolase (TIGR01484 family)